MTWPFASGLIWASGGMTVLLGHQVPSIALDRGY